MANSTPTPAFDDTGLEGLYVLTDAIIQGVLAAVGAGDGKAVGWLVSALHPTDVADLIECLPTAQRNGLEKLLGGGLGPHVFAYLDASLRDDLIYGLYPSKLAKVAAGLESDEAVGLSKRWTPTISRRHWTVCPPATA
jgi:magnesium transporter